MDATLDRLPRATLAVLVALAVAVPGVMLYALDSTGFPVAGSAVWVVGYGLAAALIWFGWIRHVDFDG